MTFREFILEQLKIAKINEKYREQFTDPEGLKLFQKSFTHETFDEKENYEILEFIGDGIAKGVLSQYIPRRFPNLIGEGIYSKTRRYLEQSKTLSVFARKRGFWEHVRANGIKLEKDRNKILEDVFEAFIGALVTLVDDRIKNGIGYNYAYNYITASLDEMQIDPYDEKTQDDAVTRIHEPLKWGGVPSYEEHMPLPTFDKLPTDAKVGEAVYHNRGAYIYDGKRWTRNAPLLPIKAYPHTVIYDEEGRSTNVQKIWYVIVYGFPHRLGTEPDKNFLKGVKLNDIIKDPKRYGAVALGKGFSNKKIEAKKIASQNVLQYLEKRGYKRLKKQIEQEQTD
jgi:dsRNA-specific ribonuclease